jgi:hypothetical protein
LKRACNFKYITIEWNKPQVYGDGQIVSYKLYIDGKIDSVLSSDQTSFTLNKGENGHEYNFQIQVYSKYFFNSLSSFFNKEIFNQIGNDS